MYDVGMGAPLVTRRFAPYPSPTLGLGAPFALGFTELIGTPDILKPGQYMSRGQELRSKNGRTRLVFQNDGGLVLFGDGKPLWGTGDPSATRVFNQPDGNLVVYAGDHAVWASDTAIGPLDLIVQDDGNAVLYHGNHVTAQWSTGTNGFKENWPRGLFEKIIGGAAEASVNASDLPPELKAAAANAIHAASKNIAEATGDVLAVAEVVISFVPGVGAGINAAIAAGGALARGENITDAVVEGVKNALPGGPLAATAFDAAVAAGKAIANGENIGDAALAATRAALPSEEAKRAFDVGLAVVHGQNIQQALVSVTKALAPQAAQAAAAIFKRPELMNLPIAEVAKLLNTDPTSVTAATTALKTNPALSTPPATAKRPPPVLKAPPPLVPNPKLIANLAAVARKFPKSTDAEVVYVAVSGDHVLSTNANRLSPKLISNVIAVARSFPNAKDAEVLYVAALPPAAQKPPPALKPPGTPPTPAKLPARGAYAPYPMKGTVSGLEAPPHGGHGGHGGGHEHHGGGRPFGRTVVRGGPGWWYDPPYVPEVVTRTETCQTWGSPVTLPPQMQTAARVALNVSKGQPTSVRGPDGVLYLFAFENGAITARPCAAFV